MKVGEILECCLYVDDLTAAEAFYGGVLGLVVHSRHEGRHVFFHCGQRMLLLFEPRASNDPQSLLPRHGAIGEGHVAFAAREDTLDDWARHLAGHGGAIEKVVTWPGGQHSLYFRDPSGNSLEIATPRIWGLDEFTA
jgi:catechol 2,3-dioxygenase-like lactoylglutathione lyase family enzyme